MSGALQHAPQALQSREQMLAARAEVDAAEDRIRELEARLLQALLGSDWPASLRANLQRLQGRRIDASAGARLRLHPVVAAGRGPAPGPACRAA